MPVKADISAVEVTLKRLVDGFNASALMNEIGHFLSFSILNRTQQGIDVEGNTFVPYSTSYKKVRQKKNLPIDHVDLFFTGAMLSSMTHEYTKDTARLFFINTPRRSKGGKKTSNITNPEVAYYNNEIREFFAISLKEEKKIVKMVEDYFEGLME